MNKNMHLDFSWQTTPKPIVALSPMDGYTDSAYRQIVKLIEPRAIVFSEFVSADGLHRAPKKVSELVSFNADIEQPYIAQIFGKNPEAFAIAAKVLTDLGVAGIDINYGCPAKKVVGSGHGSSMIRTSELAAECVAAVRQATPLPLSVKTRLGWTDDSTLQDFVGKMIVAGAEMVTIHGRTVKQGYAGEADFGPIYELKKKYPKTVIIGNGDITSGEIAKAKLGNLDGIMIGRASFGNPWIIHEAVCSLYGEEYTPPTPAEIGKIICRHAEILIETKGKKRAMLEFRKLLLSFTKGFKGAKAMRRDMVSIESLQDVKTIAEKIVLLSSHA